MSNDNSNLADILKACARALWTREAFFQSIGCPDVAGQFEDRALQCDAWLESLSRRPFDAEREASIRADCAEFKRLAGKSNG